MQSPSSRLVEAVAVTAELCGRTFTPAAAAMFVQDLAAYPEAAVLASLARCRREVRGALTLADVIARIDDGRPTADEAWAEVPHDERASAVWTTEAAQAFGLAFELIAAGDRVAARLAFRDAYNRLVAEARDQRRPVRWEVSLGHDRTQRAVVLQRAVERGRIPAEYATRLLPPESVASVGRLAGPTTASAAVAGVVASLPAPATPAARAALDAMGAALGVRTAEPGAIPSPADAHEAGEASGDPFVIHADRLTVDGVVVTAEMVPARMSLDRLVAALGNEQAGGAS